MKKVNLFLMGMLLLGAASSQAQNSAIKSLTSNTRINKMPMQKIPKGLTAQKVVDNYVKAIGGQSNLEKINSLEMEMSGSIQGRTLLFKTYKQKKHSEFATIVSMNGMVVKKQVYDGKKGYYSGMQGSGELKGKQLDALKKEAQFNFSNTNFAKEGIKATIIGIDTVNGKSAYKIQTISKDTTKVITYYDVKSGLKVRTVSSRFIPQYAKTVSYQVDYGDYKAVKGVKFPFSITQGIGQQIMNLKVTSLKINEKIPSDVFQTTSN